jgi:hypothetical protein
MLNIATSAEGVAAELRSALALIENPSHWLQGHYAQDAAQNSCDPADVNARAFCGLGALYRVQYDAGACALFSSVSPAKSLLNTAARKLFTRVFVDVNDVLGWAPMRECYVQAISWAEGGKI